MSQLSINIAIQISMSKALGAGEPEEWYLTSTALTGDVVGAWLAKGADDFAASLINLNDPGTLDLTKVDAGLLNWDAANGWMFSGNSYLDTGWASDGTPDTFIVRFSDADTFLQVFGDVSFSVGDTGVLPFDATTLNLAHQSTLVPYTVDDITDDVVLAMSGENIYLDGSFIGIIPGYTPKASLNNMFLGGTSSGAGVSHIKAASFYNRVLDVTEVEAITSKMQAL